MELIHLHTPNTWQNNISQVSLSCYSLEFDNVKRKVRARNISAIHRLENPYLYAQYLLQKEIYEMESNGLPVVQELFHCTSSNNIYSILQSNFDYRRVERTKFGEGISFSGNVQYARQWATDKSCIIIADVLIGKQLPVDPWPEYDVPPKGYDTTCSKNRNVYVKYFDNEFYPKYAVYL